MKRATDSRGNVSRENLLWGVRWGLYFGVGYTLWALLVYLLRGATPFEAEGITVARVVAFYVVGGAVSGGIVGLLRPLARWKAGVLLIGTVAAVLIGIGFLAAFKGLVPWTGLHTFILVVSALFGGPAGLMLYFILRDD